MLKKFKRHISSFVPTAKIESVRFRSITFQKPTTKLPSDADNTPSSSKAPKQPTTDKESLRQHDIDRISSWRSSKDAPTDDSGKKYLTPQEKKRVAFIKHDFHEHGDSTNAYIVFAHPPPKEALKHSGTDNIMDPYEAAKIAVKKCDGTVFESKTIRVDGVRKCGVGDISKEGLGEPKLSIFVGNLDFATKEEDLRAFFETLLTNERGARPQDPGSVDEHETRSPNWVTRVRVVKDKDTQLGKGFAYVQFVVRRLDLAFSSTIRWADFRAFCYSRIVSAWMRFSRSSKTRSSSRSGNYEYNGVKLSPHPLCWPKGRWKRGPGYLPPPFGRAKPLRGER